MVSSSLKKTTLFFDDTDTNILKDVGPFIAYCLRAISGIVHAHHSCGGKRGKLHGSRLSTIFKFASIRFQIRLRLVDISALSGQNKVTKICPKYLLTRYYK